MANRFSLHPVQTFHVSVYCHLSPCSLVTLRKPWLHILNNLIRRGWMVPQHPQADQAPVLWPLFSGQVLQPQLPWEPLRPCSIFVNSFLRHLTTTPKLDMVSRCDPTSAEHKRLMSPLISRSCPCLCHPGCWSQGLYRRGSSVLAPAPSRVPGMEQNCASAPHFSPEQETFFMLMSQQTDSQPACGKYMVAFFYILKSSMNTTLQRRSMVLLLNGKFL